MITASPIDYKAEGKLLLAEIAKYQLPPPPPPAPPIKSDGSAVPDAGVPVDSEASGGDDVEMKAE